MPFWQFFSYICKLQLAMVDQQKTLHSKCLTTDHDFCIFGADLSFIFILLHCSMCVIYRNLSPRNLTCLYRNLYISKIP